jgi:hypothetical protein
VENAFAFVQLRKAGLDFRQEHQTLDCIVERGVRRELFDGLANLIPRGCFWHTQSYRIPVTLISERVEVSPLNETSSCKNTGTEPLELLVYGVAKDMESKVAMMTSGGRGRGGQ